MFILPNDMPDTVREEALLVYQAAVDNGWTFDTFRRPGDSQQREAVMAISPKGVSKHLDVDQVDLATSLSALVKE